MTEPDVEPMVQSGVGEPDDLDRLWTPHRMAYIRAESKPSDDSEGECPFCRIPSLDDVDGRVAGFVMVHDDEAEQVYVDREFRGTTVASLLLTEAERQIAAAGHDVAFLVVVRGNERAQAFYARQGWTDEGDVDYPVTALGEDFISPCRKFTKRVR